MGIFGGKGKQESSSQVNVPDWLRPFVEQSAQVGGDTLQQLQRQIGGGAKNLVAPFTPTQQLGQQVGIHNALGGDGNLPTSFDALRGAAGGQGLDSFIDPTALQSFRSAALGDGFLSPEAQNPLQQLSSGVGGVFDRLQQFGQGLQNFVPENARNALSSFAEGGGPVMQGLNQFGKSVNDFVQDDVLGSFRGSSDPSIKALQDTASGSNLFGGEGFNAAVKAAVDAAKPQIASAFGGRTSQGLADANLGEASVNAFARQFGQERQNQLGAANSLNRFGLDAANQTQGRQLAALAQQGNFQQNAANSLGNFGSQDAARGLQAAQGAGNLQLGGATTLGGFDATGAGFGLQGAQGLAGLSDSERARALQAAQVLPGLSFLPSQMLQQIGGTQQAQQQNQLTAPLQALFQLFSASQGIPGSQAPLFGQSGTQRTRQFGFDF